MPLDFIVMRVTDPGQTTLTRGDDRKLLTGMHLDSHDRMPLRHRHRSRNRLCINLGREPRHVLFVNLPLMDIFQYLGLRDPEDI